MVDSGIQLSIFILKNNGHGTEEEKFKSEPKAELGSACEKLWVQPIETLVLCPILHMIRQAWAPLVSCCALGNMRSYNVLLLHPVLICLRSGVGTLGSLPSLFLSALFLSLAGGEKVQ